MRIILTTIAVFLTFSNLVAQQLDAMTTEQIEEEIDRLLESTDYCYRGSLHLERASRSRKDGTAVYYILLDLDQSQSLLTFCPDSSGYFLSRLEYAEVLYERDVKKDFAIGEAEEALDYFKRKNNQKEIIHTNYVLAQLYEDKFELEKAEAYIKQASTLSAETTDTLMQIKCRLLGSKIAAFARPKQALVSNINDFHLSCSLFNLDDDNKDDDKLLADLVLSIITNYLITDNPEGAISYINYIESLSIADSRQKVKLYEKSAEAHQKTGNYESALKYSQKHIDIFTEIKDQEGEAIVDKSAEKQEGKIYKEQLNDSEQENNELLDRVSRRNKLNLYLGFAILASFIAIYYLIRFYNQKLKVNSLISNQREEIDKQRIIKLENNMKIQSLSSMVAGQEAERNRIASDLHDSLGGTLSALKLQFEHVVMDEELSDDRPFHHIYKLIDGACSEVREIARNLKPASLEKIGLEAAIRDLINKYNANSNVDMTFNTYVGDIELEYDTKLNLYRIIQELLNNVIKHAEASEVDVQLSKAEDELIVKVEDDGKGFNMNWVKKGLGLDSMQSRVNVLKGDLNIDTAPGRGTSVIIHIPTKTSIPLLT